MTRQIPQSIERWRHHRRQASRSFVLSLQLIGCAVLCGVLGIYLREAYVLCTLAVIACLWCFAACAYHHTKAQLCPSCGRFFGEAPDYQKGESPGLSIFGKVRQCPFCRVVLEGD